ncbi:NOL1/NOP2/sun family putative RNA methylase [Euhalothece natronophila Z-M001]|uniref:NOL1/NOP2/sun family putative RNA methylase n=1 Tax=Euhalothece natronophila Z-M001 TaxID=522448 RepID=A0A5B8NNW2_9CHRO|nr:RsmB/NOP family class I SAM-dependent RNA methyltransferase [Euhalothece natronophila]QDZ40271.1 NOL1/NOP2/sun family putative RNA methylase [Euhalothece natronophila Z-M001]
MNDPIKQLLDRYHSFIDNAKAFEHFMVKPTPTCLTVNPLKTTSNAVAEFLQKQNLSFQPVSWYPNSFRIEQWEKPGLTLPFVTGWYNLQEEISLSAVQTLDPQPQENILDLCAAPGGKTVQIAMRLKGTGSVIANEIQFSRLSSLRAMLDRMGLSNVLTTNYDGCTIPLRYHSFDRILVDAPCSAEGVMRKAKSTLKPKNFSYSLKIAKKQRKLLDHALDLVKPGGIIVYSTCTFAPEENEAVIDAVLNNRGELESAKISNLKGMPGLRHWEGKQFRQDLGHAQRYLPHFNNTGGFFVARIRRSHADLKQRTSSQENTQATLLQPLPNNSPLNWFTNYFGIDAKVLSAYQLWIKGKDKIWLGEKQCQPPSQILIQTLGMPLIRTTYKPTTAALQRFGSEITCNVIELEDWEKLQCFLQGKSQPLTNSTSASGYVHVRYGQYELGCGLYKNGMLHSQLPKFLRLSLN